MKFSKLAEYFKEIEENSSRLKITELISDLLKKLSADEIDKTIYLLQGRVAPMYEHIEFGFAEKMIIKSVVHALNLEQSYFVKEFKRIGDIGNATEHFKKQYSSFEEKDLEISEVFDDLKVLAQRSGTGSQEGKISILAKLIRQLDPLSARYLARIPLGVMRLGFSDMTVLDAMSWAQAGDKSLRPEIEKAYHVRPDLGYIGKQLKQKGIKGLKEIKPALFTPILMMRAERLSSGQEIIDKIGEAAVEPKYDGFRLQIHYKKKEGEVRLYSRNLDNVSHMYPDLVEGIKKQVQADEAIFEGEAIGFDPQTGSFLPFQETVQRKRKYGIEEKAKEIPLKLFVFELLYLNGKSLIQQPFSERRQVLAKLVKVTGDTFKDTVMQASDELVSDPKKLELMFDDAISRGLEGIVAKKLSGVYQPGARASNWIKLKRSYSSKIDDTIDTLVMGYDLGRGKRTDFGIGAFLVGIYDEKNDVFKTVAKIGTGLTDDEWRFLKKSADKFKSEKKPAVYEVDKLMSVDVWVKPEIVVEIKADDITRSSIHTAGRVLKPTKSKAAMEVDTPGYALRFPRLQRFRDDKRPEEVTSLKEMHKLFEMQKK